MYSRGSDRGWHRGHNQWEGESRSCNHRKTLLTTPRSPADPHAQPVPALRGHHPRPYRGGYNAHRESGNYRSGYHDYHDNPHHDYHDYHDNPRHDYHDNPHHNYHDKPRHDYHDNSSQDFDDSYHGRDYDERQFQDYKEHRHHEDRSYHEHRESGYRRGRGQGNPYHGDYKPRGRGDSAHSKHSEPHSKNPKSPKFDKTSTKEDAGRSKNSTPNPVPIVVHNPGRNVVVLTSCDSSEDEDTPKTTSSSLVTNAKKSEDAKTISVIDSDAPVNDGKPACPQPSLERETIKPGCVIGKKPIKPECDTLKKPLKPGCDVSKKIKVSTELTEDQCPAAVPLPVTPKEEEISAASVGKRPHPEEQNPGLSNEKKSETTDTKRIRTETTVESCITKEIPIPLLDGWSRDPSQSTLGDPEKTPTKEYPEPNISDTAQVLRTAFILAKKEEIELAYAQDCKTFAFVANTLIKNDPSMETVVSRALRSTLQEIAERCVHELSSFIERYDHETSALMESGSASSVNHTHN
uniref:Periphilin-1 C-terminal domain-containing protein n=1 Tax=Leptobrachium leishanense TaxID=445787 RepID=A0A8C5P7R1_9ANUR